MTKDGLPEEKLLKIIRRKTKSTPQKDNKKSDSVQVDGKGTLDMLFGMLKHVMIFVVLALAGYLFYTFISSQESEVSKEDLSVSKVTEKPIENFEIKRKKPKLYEHYAKEIERRDIFSRPEKKEEIKEPEAKPQPVDLSKSLRLVGIVLGDVPEVIIEEIKTKKIFFMHEGDKILEARIYSIQEGKVVLDYSGSKVELLQ